MNSSRVVEAPTYRLAALAVYQELAGVDTIAAAEECLQRLAPLLAARAADLHPDSTRRGWLLEIVWIEFSAFELELLGRSLREDPTLGRWHQLCDEALAWMLTVMRVEDATSRSLPN